MAGSSTKLRSAVGDYFADIARIRASGGATPERSYYPPLNNLLNAIGDTLRPKVSCVTELGQSGADHPDLALYAARQTRKGNPIEGQTPERGVVEVKPWTDDAWLTADSAQVSKYWGRYRLVLVTNMRDFVLLGEDNAGNPVKLETLRLAESAADFESKLDKPPAFANEAGASLGEYLTRVLSHNSSLTEPRDLARLLASYARDGLERVANAPDPAPLASLRSALEDALGVRFEEERGEAFFRSTLVQTLFYGIFSAWVLWARQTPAPSGSFDWRTAVWHLRAPVLRALFQQLSDPGRLQRLGLVELMDWTSAALDRVDRATFFDKFSEGEAVQYFYEPFLQAFDPQLRKQLGVWYTPPEVVRYMVARVDRALKDDLGIEDGLAAENVYILDPCCGTGAYLAETLRRIKDNLEGKGLGASIGAHVKKAATERVFGFEIMPAPFVVAHLQVGLTMQSLDAPLSNDGTERPSVFLTNALTGWEPRSEEKKPLPFPELEEERDRADRVKQDTPILVILGNPPYDGFADIAVEEERELSNAYRSTTNVRRPEGQGLNNPYVRFFRMAERRIADKTGQGVICFISDYAWLDGLSFTGMRERFLDAFDVVRIDNLHGDRIISEYAPDGRTSETVFAIQGYSPGIRVGTAITLLSRVADDPETKDGRVLYRDFHDARANERRKSLLNSLDSSSINTDYTTLTNELELGLPFKPVTVSDDWLSWPSLPDLFPTSFPGVKTSRDSFLVGIDRDRLERRITDYFDANISDEEIARRYPSVMRNSGRFEARAVRSTLRSRGDSTGSGVIRHAYRPFDNRWLYWEAETKLLDEKRSEYKPHVFEGNLWISVVPRLRRDSTEPQVDFTRHLASLHLNEWGSSMFPAYLRTDALETDPVPKETHPNLTNAAQGYLDKLGLGVEDLFYYTLAVLHDPAYRKQNSGALRMEWPRIRLPGWPDGDEDGAADELRESAAKGMQLAALLDSETPVTGVTTGTLRSELAAIAVPTTTEGGNMTGDEFSLIAGWGHFGQGEAVMPGQGRVEERDHTDQERARMGETANALGGKTFDVYLNDAAYWQNIPEAVWNYKLGGYQVLKKWLSYREHKILNRPIKLAELHHFTNTARRIAAILATTSMPSFDGQ